MLSIACVGAGVSGIYGVLHDQITYTISPEYFTKFKFAQFYYTDWGWPPRARVLVIGFLATWWVGFFSGWFLARLAVPKMSAPVARQKIFSGYCWIVGLACTSGLLAWVWGYLFLQGAALNSWKGWQEMFGLSDLRSFAIVGCIHTGGYAGALVGLVIAAVVLQRKGERG